MSVPTIVWSVSIIIASLFTIIGNLFVIIAIVINKSLRSSRRNYLVLSLAVTDLIYGLVYMPIKGLTNPTKEGNWLYGQFVCRAYYILSYMSAFASILNLVMIAVDRYLSINSLNYVMHIRWIIIRVMITIAWIIAFLCACFMVYTDTEFAERIENNAQCLYSTSNLTLIALTLGYYIPLVLIIVLYILIYRTAKNLLKSRARLSISETMLNNVNAIKMTDQNTGKVDTHLVVNGDGVHNCNSAERALDQHIGGQTNHMTVTLAEDTKRDKEAELASSRRESRLSFVLAIITGVFIICWTPTMIAVTINIVCVECRLWSLYTDYYFIVSSTSAFNSALNPILYALFLNEFRDTFKLLLKKSLFCMCY